MGRKLIVDGYNLARSGKIQIEADPVSEKGRDELCAFISAYSREKGLSLMIVFDGRGAGNPIRTRTALKGGTVIFSSRSETADDVIRDLTRDAPAGTIVVTSDRGLAGTLPSRNILTISCEDFAGRLFDHRMEDLKGAPEEESRPGRGEKKGEGQKQKKKERKRNRLLKNI